MVKNNDWKLVMKTSSKSSLPVLLFCGLSYLLLELFRPFVTDVLKDNGFILTENFNTMFEYVLIYLVIFPIIILIFQLISKKENRVSIKSGFSKPKKSFLWIVKWLLISFSASMILSVIGSYFLFAITAITEVDVTGIDLFLGLGTLVTVPNYIVLTVPTLLFAPIFEEVFFRGVVYKNDEKLGFVFASITSSLIFGFWHMTLSQIILASVLGFFNCYLYRRTGSIFPSMILHFITNLKSVFAIFILKNMGITGALDYATMSEDILTDHLTEILLLLVLLLVIGLMTLAGFVLLVVTIVKKKMEIKPEEYVVLPMMKNENEIIEREIITEDVVDEPEMNTADIIEEPEVEEKKMSGFKKVLLYYCSPITIVTYGVLIYGLIMRIL